MVAASKEKPVMDKPESKPDALMVAPEVMDAISQMQQRSDLLTLEVGRMEFKKSKILEEIGMLNDKATALLRQEGKKLGIPDGTPWRVSPDGEVLVQNLDD
jgi:hypothetical protein